MEQNETFLIFELTDVIVRLYTEVFNITNCVHISHPQYETPADISLLRGFYFLFIHFLRTTLNIKLHVKRDTEGEKRDE